MTHAPRPVVGLVTIGQSPRVDVVPDMIDVIGPGVGVREAGALDGLTRPEIADLAPTGDDEILVTRLADGAPVFVGKRQIVGLVERRIAALEREGATLGTLRGMSWAGRLGVLTPTPCARAEPGSW